VSPDFAYGPVGFPGRLHQTTPIKPGAKRYPKHRANHSRRPRAVTPRRLWLGPQRRRNVCAPEDDYRLAALGDVGASVFERFALRGYGRTPKAKLFGIQGHAKYAVFRASIPLGVATRIALSEQSTAIWTNHSTLHGPRRRH